MQQMYSHKIIAFVEGTMERMFININMPYIRVVPISNGSSYTASTMCDQIEAKYALTQESFDLIIIWMDKERHPWCDQNFCTNLISRLVSRGADAQKIKICIPNRMTENFILADEVLMKKEIGLVDYKYVAEAKNGKKMLSDFLKGKGVSYQETIHGIKLMKQMRLAHSAQVSPSASSFLSSLNLPCWWLQPRAS